LPHLDRDGGFLNKEKEMEKLNQEYKKLPSLSRRWSLSERFVPGDGPLDAKVMLIGQAPGKNEDIELKPFIGTSGKFLTRLINIAGLDRKSVYIFSVVQFFPPLNRVPTDEEIDACRNFLFRQIEIIDPKLIVLLGAIASKTIANVDKVGTNHGNVIKKNNKTYFISMHPAAAVRIRTKMPIMERDFEKLKGVIKRL
jgi:DNA polymerase